jgi:hypothetical protein
MRLAEKLDWKGLRAFTKLRKANTNFNKSVRLPACLSIRMKKFGSHWNEFHENPSIRPSIYLPNPASIQFLSFFIT